MSSVRKIRKAFKSVPTIEGAGVHLKRAFGFSEVPMFDPFLLLDDFRSDVPEQYLPGFPWHPHRGIETITYMLEGKVEHGDSMGNKGVINPGSVQWMTAGSGIIHQEMPKGDSHGVMGGFQLWANLPRTQKMIDPRYRGIEAADIPGVELENGVKIKIICGTVAKTRGPVKDIVIDPEYLDISVPAHTSYSHPTKKDHTVFAYVIDGNGYFCQEKDPFTYEMRGKNYFDLQREPLAGNGTLLLFGEGDELKISTENESIRLLLISGKPIHEPVAWYGPIVMNTRKELQTAIEEFQQGTFIKSH
ncbi:MAG: pirin family protein [Calditrichota bacterium]|jgi:redox-sensitive bicupin YhaK (pirin superfamily)